MTRQAATALATAMLAVGLLAGAAAMVVARDVTTTDPAAFMTSHMAGAGMTSMMTGSTMTGSMMGPGASMTPADHGAHHGSGPWNSVP